MKKRLLVYFGLFFLGCLTSSWATDIELVNGASYQGQVIDSDDQYVIVDTANGMVNLPKSQIKSIDGQAVARPKAMKKTSKAKKPMSKKQAAQGAAMEKALNENKGLAKFIPPHIQDALKKFDVRAIFNWSYEVRAKGDIRKLSSAAEVYHLETMRVPSIQALVKEKYIEEEFADGIREPYKFKIRDGGGYIAINADPIDPSSNMDHYFLDEKGCIRVNKGGPAGRSSPIAPPGCYQIKSPGMREYEEAMGLDV